MLNMNTNKSFQYKLLVFTIKWKLTQIYWWEVHKQFHDSFLINTDFTQLTQLISIRFTCSMHMYICTCYGKWSCYTGSFVFVLNLKQTVRYELLIKLKCVNYNYSLYHTCRLVYWHRFAVHPWPSIFNQVNIFI